MLNDLINNYKKQSYFDNLNYLIVFLLPVFAINIREWVSGVFVVLFLLSIGYYIFTIKKKQELIKLEKYYIYILLSYFVIYVFVSVIHGWGKPQTHILGTMLHFIAIIPMYYMFRHMKYILPVLIVGSVLANIVNIIYLYDNPGKGVYGPLFSGPMIFLSCVFIVSFFYKYKLNLIVKLFLIVIVIISILTIFQLGARSAFVALFFLMLLYTFIFLKGFNRIYSLLIIALVCIGSYYGNATVKMRIDRISHGVSIYFNEKNPALVTEKFNAIHDISARFEMWRASKYFFTDNPILGFGPDEYQNEIQILIDKKLINPVAQASHPHNAYFLELYSKGLLGLLVMLLVLYYPVYICYLKYNDKPDVALLGVSLILSFTAFSLTESAAFNNNNFSSIMLIYISIIVVTLFQKNHTKITNV